MGNKLLLILIFQFLVLSIVYAIQGDWPKAMYFIGATALNLGVLGMQ
jgi:hypothetical protein